MKVIDLLNKIANNEELPATIKYNATIYYKYYHCGYFYAVGWEEETLLDNIQITSQLNDEIEIIGEKPKKIEKLSHLDFADKVAVSNKINEIIDYLLEKESDK